MMNLSNDEKVNELVTNNRDMRDTFIIGMLTGLHSGAQDVRYVYDRILRLLELAEQGNYKENEENDS